MHLSKIERYERIREGKNQKKIELQISHHGETITGLQTQLCEASCCEKSFDLQTVNAFIFQRNMGMGQYL